MTNPRPQRRIAGLAELEAVTGQEIGVSEWRAIGQSDIDAFAAATKDDYWIHTDPQRAADSEIGTTIAHGLFTLSLGPAFNYEIVEFHDLGVSFNYGYNKVRFPAPVPSTSKVRMRLTLLSVMQTARGVQAVWNQIFEREGSERPVCVAEFVQQFVP